MGKVVFDLDAPLANAGITIDELAEKIDLDEEKVSRIKNHQLSAVRLSTLANICDALECVPGDVFRYTA